MSEHDTGSWDAFTPRDGDTGTSEAFTPRDGDTGTWDAFTPVNRAEPAPAALAPAPAETRRPLRRAVRGLALAVAAVAVTGAAVGVQWQDRQRWIADRYPAEVVKDVAHGASATLHGMSWQVVTVVPRQVEGGGESGTAPLRATVQVTPVSAQAIGGYLTPDFAMRDRAGHSWQALPVDTPIPSDLKPGRATRFDVETAVPGSLSGTAELVLSYAPGETLRFAR
ncbi:hypothetical protein DQ384_09405 [Sphaerisporangium album]|uniref:DUF4352 domain-containing protein n=1 Tax=Sphaerisporangium album TaxID=509200 RepID=A0A367FQ60_9ACTN|nr:hypothetical protein [Sphaerisporangium album]RCG31745.1 hypothetical protein DQ384_09405 [Sphaerisporangium album]